MGNTKMATISQQERWQRATDQIRGVAKFDLGRLPMWNYDPCEHHQTPDPECVYRKCGGEPYGYQTVSAVYHYLARKSLQTSKPGLGKSLVIALTMCIMKERGHPLQAVLVVPTPSVEQWAAEMQRWAPGLKTEMVPRKAPLQQRLEYYSKYPLWEVLVVGYHVFARDAKYIANIPLNFMASDDVDPLHNVKNATHKAVVSVAKDCEWVIVANATPTQTHLLNLYGATVAIGAPQVWGNKAAFERRHVKRSPVYIRVKNSAGEVEKRKTFPVTGYQNMDELARQYSTMHIRYTYDDVANDVTLPDVVSSEVMLELTDAQRQRYEELQEGVFTLNLGGQTPQQQMISAIAVFTRGAQVCAGLQALGEPDSSQASCKLDWIENNITSSFEDEKVIIYATHKGTITALKSRLKKHNIGFAAIDGSTKDKKSEQDRFWQDPICRVMILSAAGERSLNLQCASVLIMLDSPWNPARVQQIAGRLRRVGSQHSTVRVFKLYAVDTQEDKISKVLAARQVVADVVNQEEDDSNLFQALTPDEILKLIRP